MDQAQPRLDTTEELQAGEVSLADQGLLGTETPAKYFTPAVLVIDHELPLLITGMVAMNGQRICSVAQSSA